MKTYINMVVRLESHGMTHEKAVEEVANAYGLTKNEKDHLNLLSARNLWADLNKTEI